MQETICPVCGADDAVPEITTPAHMLDGSSEEFHFVRCRVCDLIYLNPRVPPEELSRYYPEYYLPYRGPSAWGKFAHIAARGIDTTDARRVRRARTALRRSHPRQPPADRYAVLDVGCGQPTFLRRLHGALQRTGVSADCIGIDFVDTGWAAEPDRWEGLQLICGDPAEYSPRKPFDLITMWHYLEHDYHPGETLKRMRAAAHEATRLIIEVPDWNGLSRRVFGRHWEGWHAPRHTAVYTRDTLERLLNSTGWEVEGYTTGGTLDIHALWWMSRMERRGQLWNTSLESRFIPFLCDRAVSWPFFRLQRWLPLGVQLAMARPQTV